MKYGDRVVEVIGFVWDGEGKTGWVLNGEGMGVRYVLCFS